MFILLEVQLLHQSEGALTRTDDLRVLLQADAWRWKPTPPSSRCLHKGDGNLWLDVATSDIHYTSRRHCFVLLRSCYSNRHVVELDARLQICRAPPKWICRNLKPQKKLEKDVVFYLRKSWRNGDQIWFIKVAEVIYTDSSTRVCSVTNLQCFK